MWRRTHTHTHTHTLTHSLTHSLTHYSKQQARTGTERGIRVEEHHGSEEEAEVKRGLDVGACLARVRRTEACVHDLQGEGGDAVAHSGRCRASDGRLCVCVCVCVRVCVRVRMGVRPCMRVRERELCVRVCTCSSVSCNHAVHLHIAERAWRAGAERCVK